MDLTLRNTEFRPDGIFGSLLDDKLEVICVTLQHAYEENSKYVAKIPPGTYKCVRGKHQLLYGKPFVTFEITGVTGHTNLLFHPGNYNKDSEGCVLLGAKEIYAPGNDSRMIVGSRDKFDTFMKLEKTVNEFTLKVENL